MAVSPLVIPQARTRFGAASNPVTSASIVANVPGVSRPSQRGPVINTASQSRAAVSTTGSINNDPLQNYQQKLRQRLEQGQQFNAQLANIKRPQTKTGFQQKYGIGQKQVAPRVGGGNRPSAVPQGGSNGYRAPAGASGNLPASSLGRFYGGAVLIPPAGAALNRLGAAFQQAFGKPLGITDSYRSYAQQVATKRSKGNMAATPGKSVHGWGRALDLGSGVNKRGSREYNWMMQNAPRFGWVNPRWAQTTKIEPWHWEFVG